MKMTFKNIIVASSLVLATTACTNEWEAPSSEPSHHVVFTSEQDFNNRVQINGDISFGDVSTGVTSRTWTIPEGVADILESDNDQTSTEDILKVVFSEVGEHTVTLHQEFNGDAYVGDAQIGATSYDTSFVVTVLDSVKATLTAKYVEPNGSLGADLDMTGGALNEVIASRTVRFFYAATGEPAEVIYSFGDGAAPAELTYDNIQIGEGAAAETDVKYRRMGDYSLRLIAQRQRPSGADTIDIANFIKVVPSTDPVTLDDVYYIPGGQIALGFSREMEPMTINAEDFAVSINDGAIVPTIASVEADPNEGNVLIVTLENERVYDNDVVTVSYTGTQLRTLDGVNADAFTDAGLNFHRTNLLEASAVDQGFENSIDTNWPYAWWGAPWDQYTLNVTNAEAHTGANSAKVTINEGGMIVAHKEGDANLTFAVEAGKTYEIGVWIKVESLGNIDDNAGEVPNLMMFYAPNTNWGIGRFNFLSTTQVGEWFYARIAIEKFANGGDYSFTLRGNNPAGANTGDLVFYMDDLALYEVEVRP